MKIPHWSKWEAIFDERLEEHIKWFNTPTNLDEDGNPKSDVFCDMCCDPNHWWEGDIPKPYKPSELIGANNFEKFDEPNYKPRPKNKEELKLDAELAREAKYGYAQRFNCFMWEMLHMDKSDKDEKIEHMFTLNWKPTKQEIAEEKHEQEWKSSGCRSLTELLNLD